MNGEKDNKVAKLRRFALTMNIIVIVYSLAGVKLKMDGTFSGLPLTITKPPLIEWGVVLMSVYATFRYWYHAIAIGPSSRKMKTFLKEGRLINGAMYDTSLNFDDYVNSHQIDVSKTFPTIGSFRADLRIHNLSKVDIHVPLVIEIFSFLEDVDYSLPLILCPYSILLFLFR